MSALTSETFYGSGKGTELALPGDNIRKRHIATRASNRRKIIVLVEGEVEFEGYSIGLDSHSLQLLELPSGEVSSIALEYIVAITDGKPFSELTGEEKDVVDRRTGSFRKSSHTWLVSNWPKVYDRRDDSEDHRDGPRTDIQPPRINSRTATADHLARQEFSERERRLNSDVDSEVRD